MHHLTSKTTYNVQKLATNSSRSSLDSSDSNTMISILFSMKPFPPPPKSQLDLVSPFPYLFNCKNIFGKLCAIVSLFLVSFLSQTEHFESTSIPLPCKLQTNAKRSNLFTKFSKKKNLP